MPQSPGSTRQQTAAALIAALLAVSSILVVPIGPVPVTLQVFVVILAGLLLSPAWAGTSIVVYLLLGAAGVPVFAGATGGLGVIGGPLGGYLIGFAAGAMIGAAVRQSLERRGVPSVLSDTACTAVTVVVIYFAGVTQLWAVSRLGADGLTFVQAILAGAAPFILFDAGKAVVAILVAQALRRTGVLPSAKDAARAMP